MRSRLGFIVLVMLALAGCSEPLRHIPPPPDADERAALTVIRCGRGLTIEATTLDRLPLRLELPPDCPDEAEVNVLYLGDTLEDLGLSPGPIPESTCRRDETAYSTCCTPEPLPTAARVFSGTGGAMIELAEAPEDVAAFRHNERCFCRSFDAARIEVPGTIAPIVLQNDDTSIWVLSSSVSRNEISAFLVSTDSPSRTLTGPDHVLPFVAYRGLVDPSGDWTLVSTEGALIRGSIESGFTRTENAIPRSPTRIAGSGDELLVLEPAVVSGTSTFGLFDGRQYEDLGRGVSPELECTDPQSDGGLDGQEEGLLRLGEGDYVAMPNYVEWNGAEFAPDGYWRHQNGETRWERFDSTTVCTTALGVLADGRLIRATSARRFQVRDGQTWNQVENIAGPSGPTITPKEIKVIQPYFDGFVFAGNSGAFGQMKSGIICHFESTPNVANRAMQQVGDRFVVTTRSEGQPPVWAIKIYTPRPFQP